VRMMKISFVFEMHAFTANVNVILPLLDLCQPFTLSHLSA